MATRKELIEALGDRYRGARRTEKARILDELVAVTGYHRKHAVRVLNIDNKAPERPSSPPGRRIYDEALRQALIVLWEAADRMCGKRLKAALPGLLEAMERHGHLSLDDDIRARLTSVSAATIDRILAPVRAKAGMSPKRRRTLDTAVKRRVPVRTFADWNDPAPGFVEADFVAHCGGSMAGRFIHTLTVTDIATGWTECIPLIVREQTLVTKALDVLCERLPMGLRGFDTDNDGAFINEVVINYCRARNIVQTRSRARRKNDQAWVEQKNGAVVRRLVGYGRFAGIDAAQVLAELFESARWYVNLFQPSFKLKDKVRVGAKIKKLYYKPETPCERLLARDDVADEVKQRLRAQRVALDPIVLLKNIRDAQAALVALIEATPPDGKKQQARVSTEEFVARLSELCTQSEVRPTHQKPQKPPRTWRTRMDPFEGVWQKVEQWLVAEPDVPAKDLLERLVMAQPDRFSGKHLRTLQRRVRQWRAAMAERLISACTPTAA